ncbi:MULTISPECIES: energy-coupling factor ABC transporter permease [Halomonadaceae]|uniref:energy-coupling factor ABC transporter permease n=1 Tax=Halomonadaceae TaxID=28256 RepID=UPI000784912A|nr:MULTISPECIES: energy-coupling factor ABC transporter permease [Halomonas]MCC4286801.1 energy-coupling factor ABC transporter permease [Halomonas meridiana]MCP1302723.1 energy-coupling factor ABC transporter permease [Halomonas sp. R1t8]MCP1328774.1 energy-coupling factor ABC transporter permease [Halomonas sp. R1t4]
MSFAQSVLAPWALVMTWLLSLGVIVWCLCLRPWRPLLEDTALQHRWMAATLAVMLMWQLRAQAVDWLTLHLVFTVLMTLVFKMPLALISNVMVNVAMVAIGRNDWSLMGANVLVTGIVPATVTGFVWRIVDRRLPDNLMVFLFACGFFGTALATLGGGLSTVALIIVAGTDPEAVYLAQEYARFLPLLMPSEAFITGMLLSILLVYHPSWVATFNDHRYIDLQ